MVIVCGIDGSASSHAAARAAAALGKLLREPLELVHVQEALVFSIDPVTGGLPVALANTTLLDQERERVKKELAREADELAERFGIEVSHSVRAGLPDQELIRVAKEDEAALLVVGSIGRRAATMWRLGSVADRLSQSAPVPLLVVRDAQAFVRWCDEKRPLGVVLALGPGRPTRAAVRHVKELAKLAECRLTEVHVYDPETEARRMGLGELDTPETRDRIESALARELPGRELTTGVGRFVALAASGPVQEALAEFVDAEKADLLVVGSHHKGALHRRFRGSVSYGVLAAVESNVLVVPADERESEVRKIRPVRRVLVATDLTATGNAAVELALGLLPDDGELVLLHVDVPPELPSGFIMGYHPGVQPTMGERAMKRALVEGELDKLAAVGTRPLDVKIEVVEAREVPRAILEAAERHGVDLVCLGTHHYGRVASALIGSVARTVARRSTRPVLLVPT